MRKTDVLGAPYASELIELPDDYEESVVATLVHRPADTKVAAGAVLHVHGFCDYFFQTPLAEFYTALGYDFYGLDLRKYGRSLLPHQTPNFCLDLTEYDADLDAAIALVRERDGHDRVILSAHSTGGLIAPLWAARRTAEGNRPLSAFVLNSPWLDLQGSLLVRTVGTEALYRFGQRRPYTVIPRKVSGVYGESLHRDHRGDWTYDLAWKPLESFTVRAGWLRAVRHGHRTLHRGIDVGAPVLTLCSSRSSVLEQWADGAMRTDTVLDVEQIARWAHRLGPDVAVLRVDDAMHDVFLSSTSVRQTAFEHVTRWLAYALS